MSSERDATSVAANSECREHVGINASFENASENVNVQQVSNGNDETRNNIPDEVSELSVSGTHFHRQTHTHHNVSMTDIKKCLHIIDLPFEIFSDHNADMIWYSLKLRFPQKVLTAKILNLSLSRFTLFMGDKSAII